MSEPKETVRKEKGQKTKVVKNTMPADKRAKGIALPVGNPAVVAREFNTDKLPSNLAALYKKVAAHGKDGVRLNTLCPKTSEGKYARWLVRQLVKLEAVKTVPVKEEK